MSRRKKAKTGKKVVPSSKVEPDLRLPPHATAFSADRAVLASEEVMVRAGARSCFDLALKRLEEPPAEDPVILRATPASDVTGRTGAVSYVVINAGGSTLESRAIITLYRPDRVLSWVLTDYPKFKEYWRFEPEPAGTMVRVHLGYEVPGTVLSRFWQEVVGKRRMEGQARRLLEMLKEEAESAAGNKVNG